MPIAAAASDTTTRISILRIFPSSFPQVNDYVNSVLCEHPTAVRISGPVRFIRS